MHSDFPLRRRLPRLRPRLLVCALAGAFSTAAFAQAVPDAGALLQQLESQRAPALPPKSGPGFAYPKPMVPTGGATVTLKSIRFDGATQLPPEVLNRAVAGFLNRPLDFAELQNAAIAVATTYREAGWVVRAYLPQQDLDSGVLTIQVVEAVYGVTRVEGAKPRVAPERIRRMVDAVQAHGKFVNSAALDRAVLLINDLPGVDAAASLSEGSGQAETDLVLALAPTPPLALDIALDNNGSRSTGAERLIASLSLNSPLHIGDQLGATTVHTDGSDYLRAAYSLPVGSGGWRVGVNSGRLWYRVSTPEFAALDLHGISVSNGLEARYPLIRSRLRNLNLVLEAEHKRFENYAGEEVTTRYRMRTAGIGLNGNLTDELWGGGSTGASLQYGGGHVDLTGSPNAPSDTLSVKTAGVYHKLRMGLAREQSLTATWSLYASVAGQLASKNLDSSEKFYLGGASGVRAYPSSEAGGSEGALVNLELRARLRERFVVTGFYDWGGVRVNKIRPAVGATFPDRYSLAGYGASLAWAGPAGLSLKATLARRIGSNPNPTPSGNDQDGTLTRNRWWLQAGLPF